MQEDIMMNLEEMTKVKDKELEALSKLNLPNSVSAIVEERINSTYVSWLHTTLQDPMWLAMKVDTFDKMVNAFVDKGYSKEKALDIVTSYLSHI